MEQRSFITEPSPGSLRAEEILCSSMRGMGRAARAGLGQGPVHSSKGKAHADGFLILERELTNCILLFLLKISLLF